MKPHRSTPRLLLAAMAVMALTLASCGGGSSPLTGSSSSLPGSAAQPAVGEVTISHLARDQFSSALKKALTAGSASPLPNDVDALQIEFFDNVGKSVLGPVEVDADPVVTVRDVPLSARSATVSYLRNGGFALAKDDEDIAWSGVAGSASPNPAPVDASYTRWKTSVDASGIASVTLSSSQVNGGAPKDIVLKGVAYSPAPIGTSNKDGPGLGDLFWDTPRPNDFLDFDKVWKRDLENIRAKGFNSVRVYSLIANFIKDNGDIPTPAEIADVNQLRVREHKKFLDAAWNNGVNPIYVLAGIPTPDSLWVKSIFDNPGNTAKNVYWDNNFTATLNQLKDHPAVIGFTMFNEQGGAAEFNGTATNSRHYWSQIQKYSQRAKTIAPDKLIGWAFFDNVSFATDTVEYRRTYAKAIDFYGVNAFQPTTIAFLKPWEKAIQGDTARPIFMTEFGIPATGHRNNSRDPLTIYADATTVQKAADAMSKMLPLVFQHPAAAGVFYFEWSDEWWKQDPLAGVNTLNTRQEGGQFIDYFPNLFYDEEGFGLNSIALGDREAAQVYTDKPWGKGGNVQVDVLSPKTSLMDAVTNAYRNAEQGRRAALGTK